MMPLAEWIAVVRNAVGETALDVMHDGGEVTLFVPRTRLVEAMRKLKEGAALDQLMDVCGADYPERPERFDVVYHLLSLKHNARLRVKTQTDGVSPVPSVVGLYPSAGWSERETFDLFGVSFEGNPDLRRLLTDYGFEGHPLRKDFPLSGFVEVRYDEESKKIVQESVRLMQDYRPFDALSPWDGMTDVQRREKKEGA